MKLRKNKRAAAEGVNTIRILILVLVIAGFVIAFAVKFAVTGAKTGTGEACKLSIIAAAETELAASLVTGEVLDINCPYEELKITKRDVSRGGEVSQDLMNGIIASELYACYQKTAGSEFNPFEDEWGEQGICVVCAHIDLTGLYGEKMIGLPIFLAVKRIPHQKKSFYEALYGQTVTGEMLADMRKQTEWGSGFPIDQPYVILWRIATKSEWAMISAMVTSTTAGGAAAGIIAPGIGNVAGGIVGGLAGFGAGVAIALFTDKPYSYSYQFAPEAVLGMTRGELLGPETDNPDSPYCYHLIDEAK